LVQKLQNRLNSVFTLSLVIVHHVSKVQYKI
jgi:hypothetical protein